MAVLGLREHLRRIGSAADKPARAAAFDLLAEEAELGDPAELLERFLSGDTNGQRFALEIAVRLTPPLPANLIDEFVSLTERSRFPTRLRVGIAAQIIRSVAPSSPHIPRIVEAFRRKASPSRAVNRLRRLADLVPGTPAIVDALAELETGTPAACPRCGTRLGPDDLVRHLWEKHRLLLENGRVREPWDVVGELLADFKRTGTNEYLDRACDLAQALDPAGGLSRVHRLVLLGGADDEEARTLLRAEAAEKHGTLCPHCYTLVPLVPPVTATPVLVSDGRVEGDGFRVESSDEYFSRRLTIDVPEGRIESKAEPGHGMNRRGAAILLLFPLVGLAVAFAVLPKVLGLAPIIPAAACLIAAAIAYLLIRAAWVERDNPTDRTIDYAWTRLAPRLLKPSIDRADAAFLGGLSLASRGRGTVADRSELLNAAIAQLAGDRVGRAYLTPLRVLRIADAARTGSDDLPLIADEAGLAFQERVPLDHVEALVKELRGDPTERTRRVRLRVLMLAHAFDANLEPEDLRLIGQLFPALGAAYASEDRDGLARLRLLWLYRPQRLWQRIGSATSVFDLARYPSLSENYLRQRPDLLLFQADADGFPIMICEEGVVYRDVVIDRRRTPIRTRAKSILRGGGFELIVGDRTFKFRDDPENLARRLRGWSAFLFDEFLPRARMLTRRRSTEGDRLISQKAITCPECRTTFLGLAGEIGLKSVPASGDSVG